MSVRRLLMCSVAGGAALLLATTTQANIPPGLSAELLCKVENAAVVCFAKATPTPQSHITYSRVDVMKTPSFLKLMLGSSDYVQHRDGQPKLRVAFAAERAGKGDVVVRVRAVVCAEDGSGACPQLDRIAAASVVVSR